MNEEDRKKLNNIDKKVDMILEVINELKKKTLTKNDDKT